jgi:hypothetical protein
MSKRDQQKLSILVILLAVLALTIVLGYRMDQPATTAAVQVPETKTSTNLPAPTDARIRLDLVEKSQAPEEIGRKNVFQYRQLPPPPAPPQRGGSKATTPPAPPPPVNGPPANRPAGPVVPPPPPPIPLKYPGYAIETSTGDRMTAFLLDDASHHYLVTVGEVLMGRYRVTKISTSSVEIEDLESNRRQLLPLLK